MAAEENKHVVSHSAARVNFGQQNITTVILNSRDRMLTSSPGCEIRLEEAVMIPEEILSD